VKISLDLDGTLLSHMAFFREFMLAMQGRGHEVGIVTAHRDIHSEADLLLLKELRFPPPDFCFCRPYKSTLSYAEFKAQTIREQGIDIAFDDCNFGSLEVESSIHALLGDQRHKLFKVTPRFPEATHYE
jgi:hypothetical protein